MVQGWVGSRVKLGWPVKNGLGHGPTHFASGQKYQVRDKYFLSRVESGQKILTSCFVMSIHEALLLLYSIKSWETLLQSHVTGVFSS